MKCIVLKIDLNWKGQTYMNAEYLNYFLACS